MNTKFKLILLLTVCAMSSACTSTKLNRSSVHNEKISSVNVNKLDENIDIQSSRTWTVVGGLVFVPLAAVGAGVDAKVTEARRGVFKETQGKINDFDVNKVLEAALQHNMEGAAFNENVVVISGGRAAESYLVPVLTPTITMSANYGAVKVSLKTSTTQKNVKDEQKQNVYKRVYSSKYNLGNALSNTENNKQYWSNNPVLLKEKIVNGLYDVAKQFSDDFNSLVVE